MVNKLNSQELNEQFLNAQSKIDQYGENVQKIKTDIEKKLNILLSEIEYDKYLNEKIKENIKEENDFYSYNFIDSINKDEDNEVYGSTIHPKFIKYTNVFNLSTITTEEIYFRNDPVVYVNGETKEEYKDILKHDSMQKTLFFNKYDNDTVKIKIVMPEISKSLGSTIFNTIEIDSYLNGSYDLQSINIKVLNIDGSYSNDLNFNTDHTKDAYIKNCGKLRILLPQKYSFTEIEFTFKINYSIEENDMRKYPFGLKHIYFLNADYKQATTDINNNHTVLSYAILKINCPNSLQLNSINQNIRLKTPYETYVTTDYENNIEFYANYDINTKELSNKLPSSEIEENIFAGNFDSFFVKVPLIKINADGTYENLVYNTIGLKYYLR